MGRAKAEYERVDHERVDHERVDHERVDHERVDHERVDQGSIRSTSCEMYPATARKTVPTAAHRGQR
jgi:hypothetical protein